MCIVCSVSDVPGGRCPDCATLIVTPYVTDDGIIWCSAECAAPYYEGAEDDR
jgi:hypothetical protein